LAPSSCYSAPCYTTFSAIYKAYRAGAHVPPPETGEVQLLKAACGQAPTGTIVSSTNLPNLDQAGIRISGNVTVRPGPGTVAVAYPALNYTGTPQYIFSGEDVCLTQLPASLAIT